MKSSSKINLPPIPPSIFNKRIPSANNTNELETENEKDKEKPTKTISPIPETGSIPIPKFKPTFQKLQKKIFQNAISEETKTYIENLKKGACNILVCVRCRPLSSLERQLSTFETIKIMDNKMLVLMDPIEYNGPTTVFKNRTREQTYAFDYAFDKYSTQKFVFENSTKFLIEGVTLGYNATVFAYGATGAGKTYTMLGEEGNPGIMPLTLKELFREVDKYKDREYKIKFWYLEIYNENIRDLLKFIDRPSNTIINEDNEYLDLREDPIKGITVSGITEVNVNNSNDMLKILKRGNRNRTIEATGANETSSRSHAIFQLSLEYKERNSGIDYEIKYSKLSLVDLAGSERASATQNRGLRLIEGGNINRSLLTLGNCINALCDAASKGLKKIYVPYRDSKLTRLLKDSLGGNARTVMIANVSPSINTFDDTYNTLKYANRAKNIKTMVSRNVLNARYHISNYVNIINSLKGEIVYLKKQLQLQRLNNINNLNRNLNINNNTINTDEITSSYNNVPTNQTQGSFRSNNNINNTNSNMGLTLSEEKFKDIVKEIKKNCDGQVSMKQKIISGQNEINKLSDIIEMNKNISSINNNLSNLISFTGTKKSKDNSNNNLNNSNNNNNSQEKNNLNEKIEELKKNLCSDQTIYKEFHKKIDKIINSKTRNNLSSLQKDFLITIIKNSNYKIQMLDIQYKNMLIKVKNEIKNNYIKELEKQIQYRDNIIQEYNIDIYSKISLNNNNIKDLDILKKDYKQKISKNFHSNFGVIHQTESNHYQNIMNTNPNTKNNTNRNLLPKSNNSQLNRINIKFNTNSYHSNNNQSPNPNSNLNTNNNIINQRRQSHSKFTVGKRDKEKEKEKDKEKEYDNDSFRPGSKANPRHIHIKNRTNFQMNNYNKNLKRNNKSYAYRESKVLVGKNKFIDNKKNEVRSGSYDYMIAQKHNKSFNEEDNFNRFKELNFHLKSNSVSNRGNKMYENEGRFITFEEIPQVKKRELNYLLNERNKKRQKFLDKINAGNKDLL